MAARAGADADRTAGGGNGGRSAAPVGLSRRASRPGSAAIGRALLESGLRCPASVGDGRRATCPTSARFALNRSAPLVGHLLAQIVLVVCSSQVLHTHGTVPGEFDITKARLAQSVARRASLDQSV
jgi:hypothetical protein